MMYRNSFLMAFQVLCPAAFYATAFTPPLHKHPLSQIQPLYSNPNVDPACQIDDEDCLTISSHISTSLQLDASLSQDLERRSRSLVREHTNDNWKKGHCPTTRVSIDPTDAVRRVCMDQYPVVACGSASGNIYLVDLEKDRVLASVKAHLHIQDEARGSSDVVKKQAMEKLYGKLDGGGVISIAMRGDVIASSGREGGVKIWKIESSKGRDHEIQLVEMGSLSSLHNTIVTSVKFADSSGLLWVSCYDGTVRSYDISHWGNEGNSSEEKLYPPQKPLYRTDFTDSVLDMHLCEELNIGVCATSDGGAALFSLEDGQFFVGIMLFEMAARSVTIVKDGNGEVNVDMDGNREHVSGYSVLCGGTDGTIHRIPLNVDSDGKVDIDDPFIVTDDSDTSIKPRHVGPVMCLASPGDGIFVSGGQDGSIRVWKIGEMDVAGDDNDTNPEQQEKALTSCKCMYALTGYKLWLGSALTDGDRLVSDGGENNIIVRDFSWKSDHDFWTGRK